MLSKFLIDKLVWAYGKAGNGNGNGKLNWKRKCKTELETLAW